eukprot:6189934-Pleurochrysis_carterae.AAC.1
MLIIFGEMGLLWGATRGLCNSNVRAGRGEGRRVNVRVKWVLILRRRKSLFFGMEVPPKANGWRQLGSNGPAPSPVMHADWNKHHISARVCAHSPSSALGLERRLSHTCEHARAQARTKHSQVSSNARLKQAHASRASASARMPAEMHTHARISSRAHARTHAP